MTWLPGDTGDEMSLQRHNPAWPATLETGEAFKEVRESALPQQVGPGATSMDTTVSVQEDDESSGTRGKE
eukprot:12913755-Prorocentrum_lima.AAC.1